VYVVKALEVVPGIGKVRARAMMREIGIDERCNIGSLTVDQQRQLQEALQS
jgi:ribosomal protein S13